eukprot:TRINITY_DN27406_c0_g1_i1.p1 TRINITY_DN27406_c0_g1~~TRINITY_DN27406_c0_g1_i1.p1  ORF type:complete len:309 (+),score=60.37 TRINITY_DN27406_c0_g1_i1:29-928(+)
MDAMEKLAEFVSMNAAFSFSSDVLAQVLVEGGNEGIDFMRSTRFAGTGVLFCGVAQFVRLRVIEAAFEGYASEQLSVAVGKTLVNQVLFSPVIRVASMASIAAMKTNDWVEVKAKIKNDFFEAQTVSYLVKPASNLIAFVVFPHHIFAQAVTIRSVAFAYNVYYSHLAHRETQEIIVTNMHGSGIKVEEEDGFQISEAYVKVAVDDFVRECREDESSSSADLSPVEASDAVSLNSPTQSGPRLEDLADFEEFVALRKSRRAELENSFKRAARLRRQQELLYANKKDRASCRFLSLLKFW